MKRLLWVVLGSLMAVSAYAASFDCSKASTKIENMICGNIDVLNLDDEMNISYKAAIQDKSHAQEIRQNQKRWIKNRNSCPDIVCLKEVYTTRITQIALGTRVELLDGKTNPICAKIALNKVSHVDFHFMHALKEFSSNVHYIEGLAKVDIGNDGHTENIVRAEYSGPGSCETKTLEVVDDSRTSKSNSKLNDVLENIGSCNSSQDVFSLRNLVYIDDKQSDGIRSIYLIRNQLAKLTCKFIDHSDSNEESDQ